MKLLFLYNNSISVPLADWLAAQEHEITLYSRKITSDFSEGRSFELLVSYNYKYLLSSDSIEKMNGNAVNLHISYLPWNKGSSPNIWSFIDNTPKGVTIHYMDSTLDTGDIIVQREVELQPSVTFVKSYTVLHQEVQSLFKEIFMEYSKWPTMSYKAIGNGSFHSLKQSRELPKALPSYDISANELIETARKVCPTPPPGPRNHSLILHDTLLSLFPLVRQRHWRIVFCCSYVHHQFTKCIFIIIAVVNSEYYD